VLLLLLLVVSRHLPAAMPGCASAQLQLGPHHHHHPLPCQQQQQHLLGTALLLLLLLLLLLGVLLGVLVPA
jgi:hypothetical protein